MALRRRKRYQEEEENHERWLVSYADFITLLFAFFVVMYAVSSVNQIKYREVTQALGSAFGNRLPLNGQTPRDDPPPIKNTQPNIIPPLPLNRLKNASMRQEQERMIATAQDLAKVLAPLIEDGTIRILQTNDGVRIDIKDSLLFTPGSAELSEAAQGPLTQIAQILATDPHVIEVEGHTDNIPIHNASFYSNWELSAVRASTVVRLLAEHGIAEQRLSATGFGDARPVTENATLEGRAKNRRVSVMLLYRMQGQDDVELGEIRPSP
jgi:chemotaxis protein MotB